MPCLFYFRSQPTIMECDVIPDCSQEIDPLGNLENCDSLSDESCSYGGALNAQIISSSGTSFIIQPVIAHNKSTNDSIAFSEESSRRKNPKNNNHNVKRKLSRTINNTILPPPPPASTLVKSNITINTSLFTSQASTMREVLASIPGFSIKPRRRSNKKMSTAAQIEQTREGCIDLETPDSILCGTNLRSLLNKHTFSMLPPLYQYKLVQLLPIVDRPPIDAESLTIRLNSSSLNNEFFARACLEWRERLSEGEFTPENQLKLKAEAEKEKSKLDPWKIKHFEPFWGESLYNTDVNRQSVKTKHVNVPTGNTTPATSISNSNYTTSSGRTVRNPISYSSSNYCPTQKRTRTVGVLTRSTTAAVVHQLQDFSNKIPTNVPDLLPIRNKIKSSEVVQIETEPNNQMSSIADAENNELPEQSNTKPLITDESIEDTEKKLTEVLVPIETSLKQSDPEKSDAITTPTTTTPTLLAEQACKRATKRSVSNDISQVKVSRYSGDVIENDTSFDIVDAPESESTAGSNSVLNYIPDKKPNLTSDVQINSIHTLTLSPPLHTNIQSNTFKSNEDSKGDLIYSTNSKCVISTTDVPSNSKEFENSNPEYSQLSTDCPPLIITDKFDPNSNSNTSDNKSNMEHILKIQNFEGVLQMQSNMMPLDSTERYENTSVTTPIDMAAVNMIVCTAVDGSTAGSDESSNSNTALVDCNGENSDDTAVEELEPSIQNLEPLEDDPIEQKFTDAENYVLESGEISGDSRGTIILYYYSNY